MTVVLTSVADPAWLPEGSRADVVLAEVGDEVPEPTALVRLLVTCDDLVLVVERRLGTGLDLPTRQVRSSRDAALRELATHELGVAPELHAHGWVRNHVPAPGPDYEWPRPDAYFAVWRCSLTAPLEVGGRWLDPSQARSELSARHWWPLMAVHPPNGSPS